MRKKQRWRAPKPRRSMNMADAERTLLDVRAVLDAAGVPFFLILGTCLGVVRQGRIIDYDIDIDLGALVEDLRPLIPALAESFRAAGFTPVVHTAPCAEPRAMSVLRDGIKTDIAGFIRHGEARFSPSGADDYCLVYPAEFFERTEMVTAYGVEWRVPSPPDAYLAFHYGRNWRTPDPNWKPQDGPARKYGYFRTVGGSA